MKLEYINAQVQFVITEVGDCFRLRMEIITTSSLHLQIGVPRIYNTKQSALKNIRSTMTNGSREFTTFIRKRCENEYFILIVQGKNGAEIHELGPVDSYQEAQDLKYLINCRVIHATTRDLSKDRRCKLAES